MLNKFLAEKKAELSQAGEIYLRVKARPQAAKTLFRQVLADQTIKIDISRPAQRGLANQELVKFLARYFSVAKEKVKIISGQKEKLKLVKISK